MTKKDISNLYLKRYKRPATANEITFYELYKMEIQEHFFSKDEKQAVKTELERQFPGLVKVKNPKLTKKIKIVQVIEKTPEEYFSGIEIDSPKQRIEILMPHIKAQMNSAIFNSLKERCEMMKRWHIKNGVEIPDDMQAVFTKYGV